MAAITNLITIGPKSAPLVSFTNGTTDNTIMIKHVSGVFSVDVIGNQLSVDTVTAVVQYGKPNGPGLRVYEIYKGPGESVYRGPSGEIYRTLLYDGRVTEPSYIDLRSLPYGTAFFWWNNSILRAAFFLKRVERIGRYLYRLTAVSGIGLLENLWHIGGVYTGQTFSTVAADIIDGAFPYSVDTDVANVLVYGWLPYATRRENLHQLLFAAGAAVLRDSNGNVRFAFLSNGTSTAVPDGRVAFGGEINYESPASAAEISEHAYIKTSHDETVTLYDNTTGGTAQQTRVMFRDAPCYSLQTTGSLRVDSAGVNHAYVSGMGTLTGKKYAHIIRTVRAVNSGATEENTKSVRNMTLVSIANSENIAKRILTYYSSAKTVRAKIDLQGERCGDLLTLNDPYLEPTNAFLESADVNASSNLLGACTLVQDYAPTGQGNNYKHSTVLTGSGSWTPPSGVTQVFAVLVGGGHGGQSGGNGYDGASGSTGNPGDGGISGSPGTGGLVYASSYAVSGAVPYSCGSGGTGGSNVTGSGNMPVDGSQGGATTFGSLSSASGAVSANGAYNLFSGAVYALAGSAGVSGAKGGSGANSSGGAGESLTYGGVTYSGGAQGGRTGSQPGFGGGGGGAAVGANGSNGANGTTVNLTDGTYSQGGNGGAGANAIAQSASTVYGCGGSGGFGGGGGGGGGRGSSNLWHGGGGKGGLGGKGGDGAPGCIILYWGD